MFDLDGTLMDNRPRSVAIFRELSEAWVHQHPEDARRIAKSRPEELAYAISDTLAKLGVSDALHEEAADFWRARFFRDSHLAHDVPVPGAAKLVHSLHAAGANIVYLTGRDLPLMGVGSWQSLRDLGFPIGVVGTELVCKPDATIHDEVYKRDIAPELARLGDVFCSFDNEPANCNVFARIRKTCASVLLDTQHTPNAATLDPAVVCLKDFVLEG